MKKLEHKSEFFKTANEYNTVQARKNVQKIEQNSKKGMKDIRERLIKSQETDRKRSISH